jgi:hypothetical protein
MRSGHRTIGLGIGLSLAIVACGGPLFENPHRHATGFRFNNASYFWDARRNVREAVAYYRENEWRFNKRHTDRPPALCLALSGGGSRSAAFAMGVMRGLQERGTLDLVDVMSGASGGTYAMSWYYAQHLNAGGQLDTRKLFDPGERHQRCLEENSALVPKRTIVPLLGLDALMMPVNLALNGVFGWHMNTTPSRRFYEDRIKEVYDRTPVDGCARWKNTRAFFWPFFGMHRIPFQKLRDMLERALQEGWAHRPPFFVINTTAAMDRGLDDFDDKMANAIFEFTPIRFGSDALGHGEDFPFGFDRAVAISGAALDTAVIAGSSQKTLFSAANLDLGYYATNTLNPEVTRNTVLLHRVLPFPAYFSHHYLKDKNGIAVYLTDGGHSENLAAFSLVRRMCDRIIIVDGEHDPGWNFGGYHRLQRALRSEMNVDLYVEAIDKAKFDGTTPVMRGNISCFPELKDPEGDEPVPGCPGSPQCASLNACDAPGMHKLEVDYVKLSLDPDPKRLEDYGENVRTYHDDNLKECTPPGIFASCTFPQQPTTDQWFSGPQFLAYRDLGYDIVRLHGNGTLDPR